jgi:hypothetical protein
MENEVRRKVLRRDYYLLGIKKITCKKGSNTGKQMGIVDLQVETVFDDNTSTYNLDSTFIQAERADAFLQKHIPARHKISIETEPVTDLHSRPVLLDINAID